MNYILGPGDELQISVYGVQEYNASIRISRRKSVDSVRRWNLLSGISIEAATQKIKAAMSKV
jgi:protein involved in polysaccharide export with SLBB domain